MTETDAYVKKLYNQELGYRGGQPGKAGRYFFVSKNYTDYFPPLSKVVKNDFAIIKIMPPNSDKIVLAKYVYHNSKISEGKPHGRDEYRIYMNSDIDPDRDYFKRHDIIVIYKNVAADGNETFYKIYHFPAQKMSKEYKNLEQLLQSYSSSRSVLHGRIPISNLPFIKPEELKISDKISIPDSVREAALNAPFQLITEDQMKREFVFTRHIRAGSFRDLTLFFYEYKCAVTGTYIQYKDLYNIEAAHIIPDSQKGPSHPKNGIALSRDMHWAFDKGFFSISPDYNIIIHEKVKSIPVLSSLDGKKIFLPSDERAWPSEISLNYHRKYIFGIFAR